MRKIETELLRQNNEKGENFCMKMKGFLLACVLVTQLTSCGGSSSYSANSADDDAKYVVVDTENRQVSVTSQVNGKYFTEATRHGVVFKGGSNGEKSVLRGLGSEIAFYEALMSLGFNAGNNVTVDDMSKGVHVEGDRLDVFVTWEGLDGEIPFADIIRASEERPMDIRFGGNLANAENAKTGCILCLDSCAVGIVSNTSYETGASNRIQFFGIDSVLPPDGTEVIVIFRAHGA